MRHFALLVFRFLLCVKFVGFFARHLRRVVLPVKTFPFARLGDGLSFHAPGIDRTVRPVSENEAGFSVAVFSYVQGKRTGVDAVDAGYAVLPEVIVEALFASPVAWRSQVAYHKPRQEKCATFRICAVDSVVADFGSGEDNELPGVGGIGQYFLIAAHAGVENDFTERLFFCAECHSMEHGTVIKRKERLAFALALPFLKIVHTKLV